jgi:adenylate cyclase
MRRVERGDLDAEVVVYDGTELGLLQAGFNHMVEQLRERERLRDLFGRHVGTDVAQRAMSSEFALGGERCEATVMFVDIIGSTALTQRRDADAVVAILNSFFDSVVRVIAVEGGFVNKFQGDGALCVFGAPVQQHDHAVRGLRAARALADELAPNPEIAAAIGVSSGEVVAGNVGAADRYEFTVIGDAVNEAARLTEQAKLRNTHILVSDRTIAAARAGNDGWIAGETLQLRGRSEPTRTYLPR